MAATDVIGSFRLDGLVAVVTGAGSGIGRACAEACAEAGARVACVDVDEARAGTTAAEIGGGAIAVRADVAVEAEVEAAFARVDAELGPVDVCFANAGIAGAGGPLAEYSLDDWREVTGVDLDGVFLTVRAAVQRMAPRGYGKIVVTGSVYSVRADTLFGAYGYAASKGGVLSLARTAAVQLGPQGIRVNAILPGYIRTDIAGGHMFSEDPDAVELRERIAARVPLRALGEASELKGLALFLASPASDYVTGAAIPVDGGWIAT
jgi:NAD(P)-dependent dehydrogenase (short-subunit alcohol dehydrogenase family)